MQPTPRDTLARAWASWVGNDLDPVGPVWLQWLLTVAFCVVVAMCFTLLAVGAISLEGRGAWARPALWADWFAKNLVVSLIVGGVVHLLFALTIPAFGKDRIRAWSDRRRSLFFAVVPLAGVVVGWPIGLWVIRDDTRRTFAALDGDFIVGLVLIALLFSFVLNQIFGAKARQVIAERRAVEAQLRLLQAQMEPHFLFNTLAGVRALIDVAPQRAQRMLDSFTDYLRATVASLRTDDSTLGHELALAEAYLALMRERMEDRLRYSVAADAALHAVPLPPLLLQPLVENAIRHGLEPKVDGGSVHVTARRDGRNLVVEVRDDATGADAPRRTDDAAGAGIALANIRHRLQARWGGAASLTLMPTQPGTAATLRLPLPGGSGVR